MWIPDYVKLARPGYRSLAALIERAIADEGQLNIGDKLPPHREMAFHMKVSLQTVSRAYDILLRKGLVDGQVGRGTYVKARQIDPNAPYFTDGTEIKRIDMSMLRPVETDAHVKAYRNTLRRLASSGDLEVTSTYLETASVARFRDSFVDFFRSGLEPNRVRITNGVTPALTLALQLARSGAGRSDVILCDPLSHHLLAPLCALSGWRLRAVETDTYGMTPEALLTRSAKESVGALFLMPNAHGPEGKIMPLRRRQDLVAVAQTLNASLIVDDAWGALMQPLPCFSTLAPDRSYVALGCSKTLYPALRLGGLIVPPDEVSRATTADRVMNWIATPLIGAIVHDWIETGVAQSLIDDLRRILMQRHQMFSRIFGIGTDTCALHRWVPLETAEAEQLVVKRALELNVAVSPGAAFATGGTNRPHGVRVCLGVRDEDQFETGLTLLKAILDDIAGF